jgi:cytidine deaminase
MRTKGINPLRLSRHIVEEMRSAARAVASNAYSPYSGFRVGAAVLTDNGEIFAGCNVENASYGLTICAERSAIFRAVSEGHRRIRALVLFTPTAKPATPCGACRQVISELSEEAEIECFCDGQDIIRATSSSLLPSAFGSGASAGPSTLDLVEEARESAVPTLLK